MNRSEERYPAFLELDLPPASPATARFHLIPVPLEASVSYGQGAAQGPRAILTASLQLEAFDGKGIPGEAGIYTAPPVPCGTMTVGEALRTAGTQVLAAVRQRQIPIVLGGEHTVSLGPVQALVENGYEFGVVQFDAQADLRDSYEDNPLSHACVMRRIFDLGVPIFQIGVRSLSAPEAKFRAERGIAGLDAEDIHRHGLPDPLLPPDFPGHLYVTFDVDALDPSIMPATGTPEPGGLNWYTAVDALTRVVQGRTVLAADVVELAPVPGLHAPDFTAAKLVYTLMGLLRD